MHLRVQRLHAPAEQLAGSGQLLDERHAELVLLDEGGRASARDELDAEVREAARERVEAGLVVHGEERALDHSIARAAPRGTGGARPRAGARGVRGRIAALDRHALLGDDRARVDALVHPVDGNAGLGRSRGERVLDRRRAGERGEQRGVDVDDALGKRARKAGVSRVHVAGAGDERHAVLLEPVGHGESRSSRDSKSASSKAAAGNARARARSSALASPRPRRRRQREAEASRMAWRFVPSPETRTPITRLGRSRGRRPAPARRRGSRCRG